MLPHNALSGSSMTSTALILSHKSFKHSHFLVTEIIGNYNFHSATAMKLNSCSTVQYCTLVLAPAWPQICQRNLSNFLASVVVLELLPVDHGPSALQNGPW